MVEPGTSRHGVPDDVKDTPILCAALEAGVDFLVTNDRHLLGLNPYEGLRIVSMTEYYDILVSEGLIHLPSRASLTMPLSDRQLIFGTPHSLPGCWRLPGRRRTPTM